MLLERLKQTGITAALNHPYPGDYILRRHGNARKNIHAIQIEVDRSLYLDSELREPGDGMEATAALVVDLLMLLADLLGGLPLPLAAE
jgi:N-formylglutamate amidohydrolase